MLRPRGFAAHSSIGPHPFGVIMKFSKPLLSVCALVVAFSGLAMTPVAAPPTTFTGEAYPLDTCPVSGEKLGKDAVTTVLTDMKDTRLNGTQMKFCCAKCETAFKADPAKYMTKVEDEIKKSAPAYPLTTCLIMTDESIDDSAKAVVFHNRVYKFCCKKCIATFEKNPAKFEKAFETAVIAKQTAGYKATKCPVSGEPLKADSTSIVINNRLVKTCCPKCAEKAKADPTGTLVKVDADIAAAEKTGTRNGSN
jgi:YHS domain-containing protein